MEHYTVKSMYLFCLFVPRVPWELRMCVVPSHPIPWDVSHGISMGIPFPWTSLIITTSLLSLGLSKIEYFYDSNIFADSNKRVLLHNPFVQIIFVQIKQLLPRLCDDDLKSRHYFKCAPHTRRHNANSTNCRCWFIMI